MDTHKDPNTPSTGATLGSSVVRHLEDEVDTLTKDKTTLTRKTARLRKKTREQERDTAKWKGAAGALGLAVCLAIGALFALGTKDAKPSTHVSSLAPLEQVESGHDVAAREAAFICSSADAIGGLAEIGSSSGESFGETVDASVFLTAWLPMDRVDKKKDQLFIANVDTRDSRPRRLSAHAHNDDGDGTEPHSDYVNLFYRYAVDDDVPGTRIRNAAVLDGHYNPEAINYYDHRFLRHPMKNNLS